MCLFCFQFVFMVNNIDRFSYVELSLHLSNEAHLIMVDGLLDVLLDSVWEYFIKYFYINVHDGNWFIILSLCCVVLVSVGCGLIKWIWQGSLCFLYCGIIWGRFTLTLLESLVDFCIKTVYHWALFGLEICRWLFLFH